MIFQLMKEHVSNLQFSYFYCAWEEHKSGASHGYYLVSHSLFTEIMLQQEYYITDRFCPCLSDLGQQTQFADTVCPNKICNNRVSLLLGQLFSFHRYHATVGILQTGSVSVYLILVNRHSFQILFVQIIYEIFGFFKKIGTGVRFVRQNSGT